MKWYKLPKNIENTYFNFIINRRKRIMDKSKKLLPNKKQCCGLNLGCYEFVEMKKKTKDLETKLAESENKVKGFVELFDKKQHENYEQFCEIMQLKQQLAEKEKEIEEYRNANMIVLGGRSQGKKHLMQIKIKELQNQTAIEQLEKVKWFLVEKIAEKQSCFDSGNYNDFADGVKTICELMLISIEKQIKSLKGEKK